MTDGPSIGFVTPHSRIDVHENHISLLNRPSASQSRRREHEPLFDEGSLGEGKKEAMMSPKNNQSAPPIDNNTFNSSETAKIAFAALLHVPTPLLVLSSQKTVVLTNHAIESLLRLTTSDGTQLSSTNTVDREQNSTTDGLQGKSLSELGIRKVQDEQQKQMSWEDFLDEIAGESVQGISTVTTAGSSSDSGGNMVGGNADVTQRQNPSVEPTALVSSSRNSLSRLGSQALVHDVVVNVQISSPPAVAKDNQPRSGHQSSESKRLIEAQMVISVWAMENQRYFTLTFVRVANYSLSSPTPEPSQKRFSAEHQPALPTTSASILSSPFDSLGHPSRKPSTAPDQSPIESENVITSPPDLGRLRMSHTTASTNVLQKVNRLKDAMIDSMETPAIAIWIDESVAVANQAASALMHPMTNSTSNDAFDLLAKLRLHTEDFGRQLKPEEYPIVQMCRLRQPFGKAKFGVLDVNSQRKRLDLSGEFIVDEKTGEFLAAVMLMKDIREHAEIITSHFEASQQQFQLICDTIPQMLWMTDPKGVHEWFSRRWSEYTGLSVESSLGENWQYAFHPDDVPTARQRWGHSLNTGEEYTTEYRCKRFDGAWRWMLGRALPLRDAETGKITKWFGTCTDIHDLVEARQIAKRTREQLLNVIKHALVTVWAVNRNRELTFLEGDLMWDENSDCEETSIGKNIYTVFGQHKGKDHLPLYQEPIDRILGGEDSERISEHFIDGNKRWYRTRFVPMLRNPAISRSSDASNIEGVIGISMDVTELKDREAELQSQEQENYRLHSAELAAKEASRLKSQFLANMSHEIRTPIAGVIGMSELLIDTKLDEEQRECAENIQRSANGLLTVINDILDLSKVESGRLDVEEVQFSLSVVIRDVSKMLSFAAGRKNLAFESNIQLGGPEDMIVMGDPGRLRQILTNLLTNSIKFTSVGSVTLAVAISSETDDTLEVVFTVEDTGIGIEEEVRKRLFQPFSQADSSTARRFGGTGLGLTICKNLVELMHGQITLDSTLGVGTHATFTIPFHKPQFRGGTSPLINLDSIPPRLQSDLSLSSCASDHGSVTPPLNPSKAPRKGNDSEKNRTKDRQSPSLFPASLGSDGVMDFDRGRIHVLVVEDNPINQQIALKTIKKFGFSVNAVWNGREALDYLLETPSADHPRPDIILMDVQMPILDGYRATHVLRHHSPYTGIEGLRAVPIIAMTASAIQGDREKCKEAGMNDYLAKPVKAKTLEMMLLKWASRRKAMHNESVNLGPAEPETTCTDPKASSHDPNTPYYSTANSAEDREDTRARTSTDNPPWLSSEGDRDMLQCEAEEKATLLRDDKLLAAGSSHAYNTQTHMGPPSRGVSRRPGSPTPALTEENINMLDREYDETPSTNLQLPLLTRCSSVEQSSLPIGSRDSSPPSSTVGSLHGPISKGKSWSEVKRGRLNRNDSDRSQTTVTNSRPG